MIYNFWGTVKKKTEHCHYKGCNNKVTLLSGRDKYCSEKHFKAETLRKQKLKYHKNKEEINRKRRERYQELKREREANE